MTTEFEFIRRCLSDYLKDLLNLDIIHHDPSFLELLKHDLGASIVMIRQRIYSFQKRAELIENYISHLQRTLAGYSNLMFDRHPPFPLLNLVIDELTEFLMVDYKIYFDFTLIPAVRYQLDKIHEKHLCVLEIDKRLNDSKINIELTMLLKDYMYQRSCFISSFHQLDYYLKFINSLHSLTEDNTSEDFQNMLLGELIYINFNTRQFITHLAKQIRLVSDTEKDLLVRQLKIFEYLRMVEQLPEQTLIGYEASSQSVKIFLLKLLESEQKYLQKQHKLPSKTRKKRGATL